MFCIHRYYCIKPLCCICMTWNCYVNLVCVSEFSNLEKCVSSIDYLSWLKKRWAFIFFFFLTRCNQPWISKEHCRIISGEWRFNITKKRKWVKCCAAEEAPQSSNPGWTGQLWLRGELPWGLGSQILTPSPWW